MSIDQADSRYHDLVDAAWAFAQQIHARGIEEDWRRVAGERGSPGGRLGIAALDVFSAEVKDGRQPGSDVDRLAAVVGRMMAAGTDLSSSRDVAEALVREGVRPPGRPTVTFLDAARSPRVAALVLASLYVRLTSSHAASPSRPSAAATLVKIGLRRLGMQVKEEHILDLCSAVGDEDETGIEAALDVIAGGWA